MAELGNPWFQEQQEYVLAVTKMLNENAPALPDAEHYYIHVELRDTYEHKRVGEWSDEIGSDSWSFSEVLPSNNV